MELTKEYFDERLTAQTEHFDRKLDEQTESLARMVNAGFDAVDARFAEVINLLDVRERLEKTERQVEEIRRTLKLA